MTKVKDPTETLLRDRLGARFIALRIARKIKRVDVSRLTGIPTSTLFDYERGTFPPIPRLLKLVAVYQTSLEFLLTGSGTGSVRVVYWDQVTVKPEPVEQLTQEAIGQAMQRTPVAKMSRHAAAATQGSMIPAEITGPITRRATSKKTGKKGEMKFNFEL